jgi:hypothetical protein
MWRILSECPPLYGNSLLKVVEGNLSYLPSSIAPSQVYDTSLYHHMKLTAATASCLFIHTAAIEKAPVMDSRSLFCSGTWAAVYEEEFFLLYSVDLPDFANPPCRCCASREKNLCFYSRAPAISAKTRLRCG